MGLPSHLREFPVVVGSGLKIAPLECNMVPALRSFFDLVPGDFSVSAGWRISNDDELIEFRLVGSNGVVEWNVPHEQSGPATYSAVDRSSHLTAARSVSYRLLVKSGADEWALLAEEEVTLGFPDLTTRILATSPNPFNPLTTVSFEIPKPIHVHLAVYDLSGKRVATLAEEWISAGNAPQGLGRSGYGRQNSRGRAIPFVIEGGKRKIRSENHLGEISHPGKAPWPKGCLADLNKNPPAGKAGLECYLTVTYVTRGPR